MVQYSPLGRSLIALMSEALTTRAATETVAPPRILTRSYTLELDGVMEEFSHPTPDYADAPAVSHLESGPR